MPPGPFTALAVADQERGIRGLNSALKEVGGPQTRLTMLRPDEAQDALQHGEYNLIVLRDAPPECDAIELMNSADAGRGTVVIVAAHDDCSRVIELYESGAYDVVTRQQVACGLLSYSLKRALEANHTRSAEQEQPPVREKPQFADDGVRRALQNSPITVWQQDKDLRYTWILNPAAPITDPQEMLGKTDEEIYGAAGAKELIALKQKALESGEMVHDEIRLVARKRITYHNVAAEPQRDEQGNITGMLGTSVNVTAAHRTEDELREAHDDLVASNQRLRKEMRRRREVMDMLRDQAELLDLAQDAIVVCDEHDRILYWNRGAELTYGYTAGEAVGQITYELLKTTFPVSFENLKARLLEEESFMGELEQTTKDGRRITLASRWTVRHDHEKEITFLQINRDITERNRMETALRENEARLALAQRSGRVGTYDWNMQTGESFWSEELEIMHGVKPGEGGVDVGFLYMHPQDQPDVMEHLRDCIREQLPEVQSDFRIIRPDGQVRWISNRGAITYDDSGAPLRMIGASVDITERKEAEAALAERAEQLRHLNNDLEEMNAQLEEEIRDRKRAEEEAQTAMVEAERQRAQLEAVFQSVDDGIVVTDMSGMFLLVNEAEAKIAGYASPEEMKKDLTYFASVFELMNLDGTLIPVEKWPISKVLRGERVTEWEVRGRRKDTGQEWYFSYSGEPVRDSNNNPVLAVVVTRDITERKRASEALAARAEELNRLNNDLEEVNAQLEEEIRDRKRAEEDLASSKAILAQAGQMAHVGAWEIELHDSKNVDTNPLNWSDEVYRIFGYEPGRVEVTNDLFFHHVHPDDRASVREAVSLALKKHTSYSIEHRILRPDGMERVVVEHAEIVFDNRGRPLRMIGAVQDITERKNIEEQIRQHNEQLERLVAERTEHIQTLERQRSESERQVAIGRMAARIAHEINNPLAGVKNSFLLVKKAIPTDYKHYDFVERIDKELDRIARIVRQMFELYRPERHEPDIFKPADLIYDVVLLLEGNMRARGVTIQLDTLRAQQSVTIHGDSLKQILFNLLQNAIEASQVGGWVRVAADVQGTDLNISITDRGVGIPEEVRDRVFEPFFTTKEDEETGGLGLGLSVTRSLVQNMGGMIAFESQVGQGTTFHISLPVKNEKGRSKSKR
jgi:two-component system sporulation sensor kinase C